MPSEEIQDQLAELQLVELCYKAAKLNELVVPKPGRSEREWDRLWERLEERFLTVGLDIPSRLKAVCVCRLLRGVSLHLWHEVKDVTYEAQRDRFMLSLFPVSQEYTRLCRPIKEAGEEQPQPESPQTDSTAASKSSSSGSRPGRLSLPTVRAQVLLQKSRIQRLVDRHPNTLTMPTNEELIKYAQSLMRPNLVDLAAGLDGYLSLEEYFDALALKLASSVQPSAPQPRASKRPRRIRNKKAEPETTANVQTPTEAV
eukprot:Blabericola_migrator_1__4723@NODE_2492_length_2686_cov_473_548683_g1562_i0_p2_GENE_NODE_2492_length_2686_cov_473_548683_g1562_i0NODE_2492_length_2686_cov_473_548683_g1562_i0_p2_ORF_typecomplete_len257_score49_66_NODE_2492_length_2686_cov_473_548683_g1562_i017182488